MVNGLPRSLLRLEGLVLLGLALVGFDRLGTGWVLFAALFLIPDLGMTGYFRSPRLGAVTYDLLHTLVGPAVLGASAFFAGATLPLSLALIWVGHIGLDRALGYGLKYPSGFGDTHLGSIGRAIR